MKRNIIILLNTVMKYKQQMYCRSIKMDNKCNVFILKLDSSTQKNAYYILLSAGV